MSESGGFERTPPQNIEAEMSVLGGMLLSKDAVADVTEILKPDDFYRPSHSLIFEIIMQFFGEGQPADAVTVGSELQRRGELERVGGLPYLHSLVASVPTAANASYYATIVREQAQLRSLVEAGTRIVQLGYSTDGAEVDQLVNMAQSEVYSLTDTAENREYAAMEAIVNDLVETLVDTEDLVGLGVDVGEAVDPEHRDVVVAAGAGTKVALLPVGRVVVGVQDLGVLLGPAGVGGGTGRRVDDLVRGGLAAQRRRRGVVVQGVQVGGDVPAGVVVDAVDVGDAVAVNDRGLDNDGLKV